MSPSVLPRWSGDVLDLVVDFVTYVFVPAYAIAASGLLPPLLAMPAGLVIVVTGALYFADRDMKTADNYFRGFPALWNAVAFYLFLLKPPPWLAAVSIVVLAVLTFVPFKFVHPFRVTRLARRDVRRRLRYGVYWQPPRCSTISTRARGSRGGLVVIGLYFVAVGLTDQWMTDDRTAA